MARVRRGNQYERMINGLLSSSKKIITDRLGIIAMLNKARHLAQVG
jgi:hypothetical protein